MAELTREPIDCGLVLQQVRSKRAGAVVLFLGTTREITGTRQTRCLDYEAYAEMARRKLEELESDARRRWGVEQCAIVHRLGRLEPGETSVAIAVSAPHRREAFQAAQWMIDTIKETVPIWKQESWTDGTSQWVHPGMEPPPSAPDPCPPDERHA